MSTKRAGNFFTLYFCARASSDSRTRPNYNVFYITKNYHHIYIIKSYTYLEILAQCLVNEWCSFFSIGEQEYFWCSHILLDKCFVIIVCNFDWFIWVEFSSYLFQLFCFEFIAKGQILSRCWECWIYSDCWQSRKGLFIAECFKLLTVECTNSEYTFVFGSKALEFFLDIIWFSIYENRMHVNNNIMACKEKIFLPPFL